MTRNLPISHQLVIAQTVLSMATHDVKYPLMSILNRTDCPSDVQDIAASAMTHLGLIGQLNRRSRPVSTVCNLSTLFQTSACLSGIKLTGAPGIEISVPVIHWEAAFALLSNLNDDPEIPMSIHATQPNPGDTRLCVYHPLFAQYTLADLFDPKPRHLAPEGIGLTGLLIKTLWLTCGCWVKLNQSTDRDPHVELRLF